MQNLKTRQICLFFIAFVPVSKIFILPSIIAKISGSDMWISSLISGLIDLITVICLLFACKRYKTDFFTLLENTLGRPLSNTLLILYAIVFFFKATLPVNDLRNYVEITLYETIPSSFYFIPFFLFCFYFCLKPLRVLGRCADIAWIFSVIGIVLLFALSMSNVDLSNLLPLGVNGTGKILSASIGSTVWYGDGVYLLFFIGNFIYKKKDGIKIAISYLVAIIIVVVFSVFFYSIFESIADRQTYALTEMSKYSTVINNIGRFDYIGIALILFSNLFATAMPIYFATLLVMRVLRTEKKWHISLVFTVLLYLFITIFREYFYSIQKIMLSVGNWVFLLFFNLIPIAISFIPLKEKVNETQKT